MTPFFTGLLASTALILPTAALAQETSAAPEMMETVGKSLNTPYNEFLESYLVEEDGVHLLNYDDVTSADKAKLVEYIDTLEGMAPSEFDQAGQIAFYANLYNAKTIEIILDHYPVDSIRDIGGNFLFKGPWREEVITLEGKRLSLDNIEHDIVRASFDEPRVHYAFNCASIGCPNLKTSAWEAATLDDDLDTAARAYINHPRGVSVDDRGRITASSIYKWFKEDFGDSDRDVLDHFRQYATGEKLEQLNTVTRINKYDYDWSLNDTK